MRTFGRQAWLALTPLAVSIVVLVPPAATAGGGARKGLCAAGSGHARPFVAVLTAFPGELAPLVAAAEIEKTVTVDERQYYEGRLEGVSVILGFTGIGIVNATTRARSVVANFELAALIMDGVAGGQRQSRIGDVVLAADWVERDRKGVLHPNPALVALAERARSALPAPLETCTTVGPRPVCLPYDPTITFGGLGMSGDNSGGKAARCGSAGDPIFGCDLPRPTPGAATRAVEATPDLVDMETAAVARAAARRRVPFLGVRAMSDGPGDPLGDRGFLAAFFDYWPLAARNASFVTRAVLAELHRLAQDRSARPTCRLLARRQWRRAARRIGRRAGG